MVTELKDVLHLYLGCEVECTTLDNHPAYLSEMKLKYLLWQENGTIKNIKPILRPLSDMTKEESVIYHSLNKMYPATPVHQIMVEHATFETFAWLLKQSFDLFGLIDSGQVIDKTKT